MCGSIVRKCDVTASNFTQKETKPFLRRALKLKEKSSCISFKVRKLKGPHKRKIKLSIIQNFKIERFASTNLLL